MKLKEIERTGWLYNNIPNPESVADHSFGVAMLALSVPLPKDINRDKLVRMALMHDLCEADIGDTVYERGNSINLEKSKDKDLLESKAINDLFNLIGRDDLKKLALEYVEQKTKTARFLKELDKLEMVLQALKYEEKVRPSNLNEFWENAKKYLKNESLKNYFDNLIQQRRK